VAAVAAFAVIAVALFPAAFLGGRVFYYRDIHLQWAPQMEVLVRCVLGGSWPVWNPYASFGQPLLANPNYEVYYPTTALNLLMKPWTYYRSFVFLHFVLAAGGVHALARRLGASPIAAAAGGIAWMASGPFVSLVTLWNHLAAAAWIPWSAWAGHRLGTRPSAGAAVTWGAVMAMPVLAGSPEMTLCAGLFGAAFALGAVRSRERLWPALPAIALSALVALGLSAAQWAPSLELARRSRRADYPAAQRLLWSIPPVMFAQGLLPILLDEQPLRPAVRASLYDSREPFLRSLYLGLSCAPLVAVALVSRRRAALVLAGIAAVMAVIALGRHSPALSAMEALLPPLRVLRFPAKAMVPLSLAWALLAALGLQAWVASSADGRARFLARIASAAAALAALGALWLVWTHLPAVAFVLIEPEFTHRTAAETLRPVVIHLAAAALAAAAMMALAWRPPRSVRRTAALAAATIAVDLVLAHSGLTPAGDPELFTARPPALAPLPRAPAGRVFSFDYFEGGLAERVLGHHGYLLKVPRDQWPVPWADAAALRFGLYPSVLAFWGIQDGFRSDWLGLYPPPMTALVSWTRRALFTPAFHRLLRIGAVSQVVALHEEGLEDLVPAARVPGLFLEDVRVFTVPDALPEAYVVGGVRVAGDTDAGGVLVDASFDPRREVVLASGAATAAPESFTGEARIVDWRPDRVAVDARLSAPGQLVLVEAYDPSWRATVDGHRAEVVRANVGFRAVALTEGSHRVVFTYRPVAAMAGVVASLVTVVACAVVLRRRRFEAPRPEPA